MRKKIISVFLSMISVFILFQAVASAQVRFKIKIDSSLVGAANQTASGRLLIFMNGEKKPLTMVTPDLANPDGVWMTGVEVSNLEAGKSIEIDPDILAAPRKFSEAPAGEYQVMAMLDANHNATYNGMDAGDFYSNVVKMSVTAEGTGTAELTLVKLVPEKKINESENLKLVEFESPSLTAFWGRPIKMQARVVLPPGYSKSGSGRYPTVYVIHGYGGNHLSGVRGLPEMLKAMREGKHPEMIYVYLNANNSFGHHVFADSVNNGPWGRALTTEFIPYLEKQFRMDAKQNGRFLTGHSSGGWATLWLQINYPEVFGGTWSTSPDPVDFRNFTGLDITRYPAQNAYYRGGGGAGGKEYNLVRMDGKEVMSLRQFSQMERILGSYGGQMSSFEAVFSPKGPDGQPMQLFDRDTGRIDPSVQKAWEKYDISRLLRDNWKTLAPKLKGKLHILVGTADTFHLDESVRLLDAELKKLGSDARIEYLEGRTHFDMYKDGLGERIAQEMYRVARPKAKAAAAKK